MHPCANELTPAAHVWHHQCRHPAPCACTPARPDSPATSMLRCCLRAAAAAAVGVVAPLIRAGVPASPALSCSGLSDCLGDTGVSGSCRTDRQATVPFITCAVAGTSGCVASTCHCHFVSKHTHLATQRLGGMRQATLQGRQVLGCLCRQTLVTTDTSRVL